MNVKFMYNGIKVDGKLYKGWYSLGGYKNMPEGTITIYARDYEGFPRIEGLQIENNTDYMTDYFEKDRIRVKPDNKWYPQVLEAYNKQQAKRGLETYHPDHSGQAQPKPQPVATIETPEPKPVNVINFAEKFAEKKVANWEQTLTPEQRLKLTVVSHLMGREMCAQALMKLDFDVDELFRICALAAHEMNAQ